MFHLTYDQLRQGFTAEMLQEGINKKDKATRLFSKRKYGRALRVYTSAFDYFPKSHEESAHLHCEVAACYLHMPPVQYHHVISECSAALAIKPDFSRALVSRARGFIGLDKSEEAKKDLSRALEVDSEAVDAQNLLDEINEKEKANEISEALSKKKIVKEAESRAWGIIGPNQLDETKKDAEKPKRVRISPAHSSTEAQLLSKSKSSLPPAAKAPNDVAGAIVNDPPPKTSSPTTSGSPSSTQILEESVGENTFPCPKQSSEVSNVGGGVLEGTLETTMCRRSVENGVGVGENALSVPKPSVKVSNIVEGIMEDTATSIYRGSENTGLGEMGIKLEKSKVTRGANVKDTPQHGAKSSDEQLRWFLLKLKSIVLFCYA